MATAALPTEHIDSMLDAIANAIAFGQAELALELADGVLAVEPDQPDAALLKAEVLDDLGRIGEALATLEAAAAHHGDHAVIWQRLGDIALSSGDTERAVEAYRQWQRLVGPTPDNEAALALAYLVDLDLRRAGTHADAAVSAGGDDDTRAFAARLGELDGEAEIEAEAGWWLGVLGAHDRGVELLTASLDRRDDPLAHHRLGELLAGSGRLVEAIPHFRAAARAMPDRAAWTVELGTALLLTGDTTAAECFDAVLAASPDDPGAIVGAGRVAIQGGDPQRALALVDRLLGHDPHDTAAWILRSEAHGACGRPAHALVDAELAIGSAPDQRRVWVAAATAATAAGHDELARHYEARATIRLAGNLGFAEDDEAMLLADLTDDLTDELHELDPIVVADPMVREIYIRRAQIAASLFHTRRALNYVDAALDRGTLDRSPEVTCYRAQLLMSAGELEHAEVEFRSVLADVPGYAAAEFGVAEIGRRRSSSIPNPERGPESGRAADRLGPWTPTHHAPPSGTAAYHAPGGTEPPLAELQPGLQVQLLEQSGNWAHVRCENDWECWADIAVLVPIRDQWSPSHRVPSTGMASRTAPYPDADDAGEIAGGLPVEVLARAGGWAHVRFENDWTCWVAGDPLQPLA